MLGKSGLFLLSIGDKAQRFLGVVLRLGPLFPHGVAHGDGDGGEIVEPLEPHFLRAPLDGELVGAVVIRGQPDITEPELLRSHTERKIEWEELIEGFSVIRVVEDYSSTFIREFFLSPSTFREVMDAE